MRHSHVYPFVYSKLRRLGARTLCSACIACGVAASATAAEEEPVENIVVTASPVDRSADELAKPVTVLDRDELLQSVSGSIGDELATRAGISSTGYAAGASRPVIRGQDSSRVRVLE